MRRQLQYLKEAFDPSEGQRRFSVSTEGGKLKISYSSLMVGRGYLLLVLTGAISIGFFTYMYLYFPLEEKRLLALIITAATGLTMSVTALGLLLMVLGKVYTFDRDTDRVMLRRQVICRASEIGEVKVLKQTSAKAEKEFYVLRIDLHDGKQWPLFRGNLSVGQLSELADTIGDYLRVRVVKAT